MKTTLLVMILAVARALAVPLGPAQDISVRMANIDSDDNIQYPDFHNDDDNIQYPDFDRDEEASYPDAYVDD